MEIREAVDVLENTKQSASGYGNIYIDLEKLSQIISLLRQGEAYKTIFRKITTNGYFSSIDTRYLLELEQKYFPKGEIK